MGKRSSIGCNINKILIVDGDESIKMLYADELTEEGYEVLTSSDGSRLMELTEQNRRDLIILHIRLGKYNGLWLLQDIRNTYHNLPVILCTGNPICKYDPRSIDVDYYGVKSPDLKEIRINKMALSSG